MRPIDEQLNRAAAEVCGWICRIVGIGSAYGSYERWGNPSGEKLGPPDYCNDRNALPELWAAVEQAGEKAVHAYLLYMDITRHHNAQIGAPTMWAILVDSPREHVIAALRALGKWNPEWDEET